MMKQTALMLTLAAGAVALDRMVLVGDSWGTEGKKAFYDKLKEKNSNITADDICVSGSTAKQWSSEKHYKEKAEKAMNNDTEVIWLTLMGNDVKNTLPACGLEGFSTDHCIAKVRKEVTPWMEEIVEYLHGYAPNARIVGFGYDIMGFGTDNGVCHRLPALLLPRCDGNTTCFNSHFLTIQDIWEEVGSKYPYVDTLNLLGSIQAASGDTNATIGHPDLATYSPGDLYLSNCIHPNYKGFGMLFENMYDMYLNKFEPKQ